jgi:hypothetical protein
LVADTVQTKTGAQRVGEMAGGRCEMIRGSMIQGPVLPQLRASVWANMAGRLGSIERGLELLLEGVDCSAGRFGLVEGLARDAMGAPVLVLVAVDGDGLLTARAHAACEFLARLGDSLLCAVPEANLVAGVRGRVLVIGTDAGAGSLDLLCRLPLPGLEVCRVETFRLAGSERLSVRWLHVDGGNRSSTAPAPLVRMPEFEVPGHRRSTWDELRQLCERIDPGIAWDGDRFSRRLTWQGRGLGRIVVADGELLGIEQRGAVGAGAQHPLRGAEDVRRFFDRLLRNYAQAAGLCAGEPAPTGAHCGSGSGSGSVGVAASQGAADPSADAATSQRSADAQTLRSTLATARLSPEEYSALGEPTTVGGAETGHGNIADDVARIVTAKGGPWHVPRRTD